ncbi:MAG: DegT/DnrJ/EryC1/StrS family aminotransferase [Alphaproteobacteria bacterium]|nr:DegT/DnrJ/EryC1/StrS family aminotransferase [Alphaproteobacteria bacterium]
MSHPASGSRSVPFVNFSAQFAEERSELLPLIEAAFAKGEFVGGAAIELLEAEAARWLGARHVVALNSGTDALILGMKALGIGPGDEVITPPNSFVASTAAVVAAGATPVFVDVLPDQNIDPQAVAAAVTSRTRAIMPVHLTGRIADMAPLKALAERHGLAVVEDAAQSFGSRYDGRLSGTFGHVGCFSAHPLKNLNAAGDAGLLVTDDDKVAGTVRLLRNHGLIDRNRVEIWGGVSRLDTIQAEILRLRLRRLGPVLERRRANAALYHRLLADTPVFMPPCRTIEYNTFHTFVVQVDRRDDLQAHLTAHGIGSAIHYPVPIHLQPAAASLGYGKGAFPVVETQAARILSLPVNQYLTEDDIAYVSATIREFFV